MNGRQVAEALALCAGGCSLPTATSGGSGTLCRDLMHALAIVRVPEVARLLVRTKYLMEDRIREIRAQIESPPDLLETALREWLSPEVCLTCNGEGSRIIDARSVVCPTCQGNRVGAMPWWWHAKRIRDWDHRSEEYHILLSRLRSWEDMTLSAMAKRLSEPECVGLE